MFNLLGAISYYIKKLFYKLGLGLIIREISRAYYKVKIVKEAKRVGDNFKVNGYSKVNSNTLLKDNVIFNGLIVSGRGYLTIGNNFHSGIGCLFITQNHNYDGGKQIPYDDSYILKDIIIEDNVWLGSRVIVLGDVRIGEGAIIQAGSVVVNDIPECSIGGGHPTKVFKYRDKEHYYNLKRQNKYH